MQVDDKDLAYIWDMWEAANEIVEFVNEKSFHEFNSNKMLRYAIERQLLVIGEAAHHISESFRENHSEIPWQSIVGQRNVIAHEYGEILVERIWYAATKHVPELIQKLEPFVPPTPSL